MLLHKVISMHFPYSCSKSLYLFNDAMCFITEIFIDTHKQFVTYYWPPVENIQTGGGISLEKSLTAADVAAVS